MSQQDKARRAAMLVAMIFGILGLAWLMTDKANATLCECAERAAAVPRDLRDAAADECRELNQAELGAVIHGG